MALKIAKNSGLTDIVTESNPITTQHVNTGESKVVQLWVFNDSSAKRYEGVTISPVDTSGTDEKGWFQLSLDGVSYQPAGAPLTIGNINTANSGIAIHLKVTTPSVSDSQNKTDLALDVIGTEFAV